MLKSHLFTLVAKKLIQRIFRSLSHPSSCIFPHYPIEMHFSNISLASYQNKTFYIFN